MERIVCLHDDRRTSRKSTRIIPTKGSCAHETGADSQMQVWSHLDGAKSHYQTTVRSTSKKYTQGDGEMMRNLCYQCQEWFFTAATTRTKFCEKCKPIWMMARSRASTAVAKAVKAGQLKHPSQFICTCGNDAAVYDHRDYSRPLEVEPVCDPCNSKRGRAARLSREFFIDCSIRRDFRARKAK